MRDLGPVSAVRYPLQEEMVGGWVNFNGTGTVAIFANFNVSSITDNAQGDWTVNWAVPFLSTNYALSLLGRYDAAGATGSLAIKTGTVPTASSVTVRGAEGAGDTTAVDMRHVCVVAYGRGLLQQVPDESRLCSTWAQWNTSGVITDSENVSSITDNAAGDWAMNFLVPYASEAVYAAGGMTQGGVTTYMGLKQNAAMLAGSVTYWTGSNTGNQVDPNLAAGLAWGYY